MMYCLDEDVFVLCFSMSVGFTKMETRVTAHFNMLSHGNNIDGAGSYALEAAPAMVLMMPWMC